LNASCITSRYFSGSRIDDGEDRFEEISPDHISYQTFEEDVIPEPAKAIRRRLLGWERQQVIGHVSSSCFDG
jgi:hypothetical protein